MRDAYVVSSLGWVQGHLICGRAITSLGYLLCDLGLSCDDWLFGQAAARTSGMLVDILCVIVCSCTCVDEYILS